MLNSARTVGDVVRTHPEHRLQLQTLCCAPIDLQPSVHPTASAAICSYIGQGLHFPEQLLWAIVYALRYATADCLIV